MKIAVASEDKNENGTVSDRAGRATYYLIFDGRKKLLETIKNPFSMGGGGAGFSVAKMLADMEVTDVFAVKFGPNMGGTLDDRNVKYHDFSGSIQDALSTIIK